MIRFSLFGIPVRIEWWFWITAALLGGGLSASGREQFIGMVIFIAAVFLSIMVHELGHALVGKKLGALQPAICLHGFGGFTFFQDNRLSRGQRILMTAAGPAAGFALGIASIAFGLMLAKDGISPFLARFVFVMIFINIFWSFFNLLPIFPLDGGQILRDVLGPGKENTVRIVSLVTIALIVPVAIYFGQWIVAIFLVMFGVSNWKSGRGSSGAT